MTRLSPAHGLAALALVASFACFEDPISSDTGAGEGDDTTSGDGDGDTGDGDSGDGDGDTGDGDGDGDTGDGDGDAGDGDGDAGDGDGDSGDGDGDPMPECPDLPPSIIYDQELDFGGPSQWSAQVSTDPPFVFEPADDIPVPEGECWCVTRVVAFGNYWDDNSTGDDTLSRVTFYEDAPNADPSQPLDFPYYSQDILAEEANDALSAELPEPLVLEPGRTWMSFMRVMDQNGEGVMHRWYWQSSLQGVDTESFRFRAEGNTLSDCDEWQYPDVCAMQDPMFDNFAFQLWGAKFACP